MNKRYNAQIENLLHWTHRVSRFLALILFGSCSIAWANHAQFTHGIASGEVTPASAVLWTRVDRFALVLAEVSRDPHFQPALQAVHRQHVWATADQDFTAKVRVEGLLPASTYFYRFRAGDSVSETGNFRTPPLPSTPGTVRFTWSSDTDGSFVPPLNQFETLARAREENADFFVYLGDTAYMDTNPPLAQDLASMRAKYKQVRGFSALRDLLASTSTYAVWDDHEVVDNYAGQTVDPSVFAAGRQAFQEYMPLGEWLPNLGFFRTFRWGQDVELFILDERSFRSADVSGICEGDLAPALPGNLRLLLGLPPSPPPGCLNALFGSGRTLLGPAQKRLFVQALAESDATWKIVINPVAISLLFGLPYDRWEGYAVEREEVLSLIQIARVKNVVFLTGDLHANMVLNVRSLFSPTPIANEFIAGPVSQITLSQSLVEAPVSGGASAGLANLLSAVAQPVCIRANVYGYGVGEVDAVSKNLSIILKDSNGSTLCVSTLTPQ